MPNAPEQTTGWQPMSEYPRDHDSGPDTYWGPSVLVRLPPSKEWPHGRTHYVAHLEADTWLTRSGSNPGAWDELHALPQEFMFIP
jgi:hypothetical protein